MEKLMIGLDICDTYAQMCCYGNEKVWNFPTIVCYNKPDGSWWLGEDGRDAYGYALGEGVIVDKLLKLLQKDGTATIAGVKYEAKFLMARFLELVLGKAVEQDGPAETEKSEGEQPAQSGAGQQSLAGAVQPNPAEGGQSTLTGAVQPNQAEAGQSAPAGDGGSASALDGGRIGHVVIAVPTINAKLMDALRGSLEELAIPRENVHIISHTESFLYFVLSQKREIWNNQVGMFDLSEDFLGYYEMKVQRGMRRVAVIADREKLDEGFNLSILEEPHGKKLADKILCACGQRFLQKKLFSSVFLTGVGFNSLDWAQEFMKLVCTRRKVFVEKSLFAQGAACKAADLARDKTAYPYVFICDGRLDATVSVKVTRNDQEGQMVLASAGDSWYEAEKTMELILDHQQYIEFQVTPSDPKQRKTVKLILEGFPERDDKTLRVQAGIRFLDDKTMAVEVRDMGFGEFYPSTGASIRQEVML